MVLHSIVSQGCNNFYNLMKAFKAGQAGDYPNNGDKEVVLTTS